MEGGVGKNMSETRVATETKSAEGRYIYCIVNGATKLSMGNIGIEKTEVCTVPCRDIAAIVHSCRSQPYESKDLKKVMEWVCSHNHVIDEATEHFGTVLPFSFDAIVKGNDDAIRNWLNKDYEKLKHELERLKDKAEYTVHIFCDQEKLIDRILDEDQTLKRLKEKMEKLPKRTSYLLHRKFELMVKDAYNALRGRLAEEFASKIKGSVEEMRIEKKVSRAPESHKDEKLIAAFSCLIGKNKVKSVGEVLGKINQEGYLVRFTGPWAPFSFVKLEEI